MFPCENATTSSSDVKLAIEQDTMHIEWLDSSDSATSSEASAKNRQVPTQWGTNVRIGLWLVVSSDAHNWPICPNQQGVMNDISGIVLPKETLRRLVPLDGFDMESGELSLWQKFCFV